MKTGIDVSYAQGNVNWGHVKADFAIIRAGYGREVSQKDSQFENNYAGCKSNCIPVGCYWYSYALTVEDAKREAATCLSVIKGKTFEYPIYFDVEESAQAKLSKTQMTAIVKAFCDELEMAGYWVGIYSYASFLKAHISPEVRARYAVWVAHTDAAKPNYDDNYGMWQYSHTGRVNGIQGNVDMNYCYLDYPTEIKNAGLNGFKASTTNSKAVSGSKVTKKTVTHTVKAEENLTVIAKKYVTTVDALVKKNKIKDRNLIYPGQKLKI